MNTGARPEPRFAIAHLAHLLSGCAYRFADEESLHTAIAGVLNTHAIPHEREFVADLKNRFDFWLDGIVIEVKVDGSMSQALRQIDRYAALDHVRGIVLAATLTWARSGNVIAELHGKPVVITHVRRQSF